LNKKEVNKMKIENIDHVTIYVRDLEKAKQFFSQLLDSEFADIVEGEVLNLRRSMGPAGIELIEPLTPDGPVARTIEKKGEGLHLVSLKVSDFDKAVAEMESRGVRVAANIGRPGARLALFHPKDTYGVMLEFVGE